MKYASQKWGRFAKKLVIMSFDNLAQNFDKWHLLLSIFN